MSFGKETSSQQRPDGSLRNRLTVGLIGGAGLVSLVFGVSPAGNPVESQVMREIQAGDISRTPAAGATCTTEYYGASSTGQSILDTFEPYNPDSDATVRLRAVVGITPAASAVGREVHFCTIEESNGIATSYDIYPGQVLDGQHEVIETEFRQLLDG